MPNIPDSSVLFAPYNKGGAGLFHLETQVCSSYLVNLLDELNLTSAKCGLTDPVEKEINRKRNLSIAYFTEWSYKRLMLLEQLMPHHHSGVSIL